MSWAFQGVANACIQILLVIAVGYVMTWRKLFGDKFLPQVNTFLLLVAFPALNMNMIGINLDLQNSAGWRGIAAYILWIAIVQVCIVAWVWLFGKRDVGEAALLNLLLVANNTIIIGLPIMDATFGTAGRYISLLTAVPLFVQVMPFSIVLFEMERWILQQAAGGASSDQLAAQASQAGGPGPGTHHLGSTDSLTALATPLPPASTAGSVDGSVPTQLPAPPSTAALLTTGDSETTITIPASVSAEDSGEGAAAAAGAAIATAAATAGTHTILRQASQHVTFASNTGADPAGSAVATGGPLRTDEVNGAGGVQAPFHHQQGLASPVIKVGQPGVQPASNPHAKLSVSVAEYSQQPELPSPGRVTARVHAQHRLAHQTGPDTASSAQAPDAVDHHRGPTHAGQDHGPAHAGPGHVPTHGGHEQRPHGGTALGGQEHIGGQPGGPAAAGLENLQEHDPGVRAVGRTLSKSHSFSQQWHAALNHFAELKRRRKLLKQQRRNMVSVVDVPLPVPPEVQLGHLPFLDGSASGMDAHDRHHQHHQHHLHHDVLDDASSQASFGGGGFVRPPEFSSWKDHPWGSLTRLLSRSRANISHLAGSITGIGSRRQADAAPNTPGGGPLGQLDSDDHQGPGLPKWHANPVACVASAHHPAHLHAPDGVLHGGSAAAQRMGAARMGLRSDRSMLRAQVVERAMHRAVRRHGGFVRVVSRYLNAHLSRAWTVTYTIIKNPMMWSLMVAVVVSASGLRKFLDPKSPQYVVELGWLVQAFAMLSSTTVPLALFSNGVFLCGKRFWEGNIRKAGVCILLKITVLPALQLLCAKILSLDTDSAMSLVLLSVCPCATTAFVVASQYNHGTEVITLCTILLTVLLVPLMLGALNLPKALGLYSFDSAAFPLP